MNKLFIIFCFFFLVFALGAQETKTISFPAHFIKTSIAELKANDSLIYFQCHVEEATQQLITASGEKITGKVQKYTITSKYVVFNNNGNYKLKYFSSSLIEFPNAKFPYLKLMEKKYWNFKLEKDTVLPEHDVLVFAAIENKTHDTNEYDFKINKQNTNEIIINGKKVMKQLIVEGNYIIKKNLEVLR